MMIPEPFLLNKNIVDNLLAAIRITKSETEKQWKRSMLALAQMDGLQNLEIDLWNNSCYAVMEEKMLKGLCFTPLSDHLVDGNVVVRIPW